LVLRPKCGTWRSAKSEAAAALYDYAYVTRLDLVNFIAGTPGSVSGVVLNSIFSRDVNDEVYCTLNYADGANGQLSVNWSDDELSQDVHQDLRLGHHGRITADRQECQIYLRTPHEALPDAKAGWTVKYTTDLTQQVWYYLRGEEYSAQIDYFVRPSRRRSTDNVNSFRSALQADRLVGMILAEANGGGTRTVVPLAADKAKGFWSRRFG